MCGLLHCEFKTNEPYLKIACKLVAFKSKGRENIVGGYFQGDDFAVEHNKREHADGEHEERESTEMENL